MLVVYSAVVLLLSLLHLVIRWRSRKADELHVDRLKEVGEISDKLAELHKIKHTPADQAHLNLKLLKAMDRSDQAEQSWEKWSIRDDRCRAVRNFLSGWLGKGFGYLCGVTDTAGGTLYVVERALGVDPGSVFHWVFHAVRYWGQP